MPKKEIETAVYYIEDACETYLGQVVITSSGVFTAITDYGNLVVKFNILIGEKFKDYFLCIDNDYFVRMVLATDAFDFTGNKTKISCLIYSFVSVILERLKKMLKEEIEAENKHALL